MKPLIFKAGYYIFFLLCSLAGILIGVCAIRTFVSNQDKELKKMYSVGIVHLNQSLDRVFEVTNPFNEILEITKIHSSCKCASAKIVNSRIPPKGSTALKIRIKGEMEPSTIQIHITIFAKREGTGKQFKLTYDIDAEAKSVLEIENGYPFVNLGNHQLGNIPTKKTLGIAKGDHPLQWDKLTCRSRNNDFKTTLRQVSPHKWSLELELTRTDLLGVVRDFLEFSFWKDGKLSEYQLIKPVEVEIDGPILVYPKSILFGTVHAGERIQKVIQLVNANDISQPVEILSIENANAHGIETEIQNKSLEQNISCVFSAIENKGSCFGTITIKAKTDKIYTFKVHYLAHVYDDQVAPPLHN